MIAFNNFCTIGNRNEYSTNLTTSPLYVAKLRIAQNGRPLTAVRFVEPIIPNFRRKSFSVPFVYFRFVRKFI